MSESNADQRAARTLRNYRLVALALLLAMAGLAIAMAALPASHVTALLGAAGRAGFIGGLADWFAVTALFRRPLGLPIPHTAIIPAQKARLARGLGRFVSRHILARDDLARGIAQIDLPAVLDRFLANPDSSRPMAENLARALPKLLAAIEDGRARRVIQRLAPRLLGGTSASTVVARALRGLTESGRHQQVLSFILAQLRETLAEKDEQLRHLIVERVREQGGRLVGWALGASIASRVLTALGQEIDKAGPYGSELREAFDVWVEHEIGRIEHDPGRAEEIGAAASRLMSHPAVQGWLWDVWERLRTALEMDAVKPNSRAAAILQNALGNLGALMTSDPGLRARVQSMAVNAALSLLPAAQTELEEFIARVVNEWDNQTLVTRLEQAVGKDLQYIRINGTIFGFIAGGVIEAGVEFMRK